MSTDTDGAYDTLEPTREDGLATVTLGREPEFEGR